MPPPAPGEVQVRTTRSGISAGTEGWILRNEFTWTATPYPCVPGYQRVGTITAVGPDAAIGPDGADWRVGDRAFALIGAWAGEPGSFWGSHLGLANTAIEHLFRLPAGVDDVSAASGVVAQVGYNAASRARLNPGDWVVAYGDGLIGQFAAQSARARGARVITVGHRAERLQAALAYSADAVVDSHRENVVDAVRHITGSDTVTAVLDSVQTVAAQRQYIDLLQPIHGQIVYCGFTPGTAWADMGLLQQRELTTHFIAGWTRPRLEATFDLMAAGRLRVAELMSHVVPAARAPEMYDMILRKSEPFMGITLDWENDEI